MSEGSPLLRENEGDQSLSNYPVETVTETVSVTVVSQPGESAAKDYDHAQAGKRRARLTINQITNWIDGDSLWTT